MNTTTARSGTIAISIAAALIGFTPLIFFGDDLPDRIATHYNGAGLPDDSMTVPQFALTTGIAIAIGAGILIALAAASRRLSPSAVITASFIGGFIAGIGAGLFSAEVISQRGNESWADATSPLWVIVWSLAIATGLGGAAARLAPSLPSDERQRSELGSTPALSLADDEHVVWTGQVSSVLMALLGAAFVLAGPFIIVWSNRTLGIVLLVSAVPITSLARVRLIADGGGLTLRYGPVGLPRQHIALDRIDLASVIEVRPTEWGGWGYRGSLTLMKQAALVLHSGPGLRLDLTGGKTFVVAVDRPEFAVSVLNGERVRRHAGSRGQ